jgi:predicted transcriptional regulator
MKKELKIISIEESESKKLGEIISNKTSRKILEHISKKEEITETDLAKELSIPLSTAHYNLQKLKELGFVSAKVFKWSEKGNKIYQYKLANKVIIIAPPNTKPNLTRQLQTLILSAISSFIVLGIVKLFTKPQEILFTSTETVTQRILDEAPSLAMTKPGSEVVQKTIEETTKVVTTPEIIHSVISPEFYFALAIGLIIIFYILIDFITKRIASTKVKA